MRGTARHKELSEPRTRTRKALSGLAGSEFPSVNGICCSRSFYSVLSVIRRHRAKKTPKMSDCVGCALA